MTGGLCGEVPGRLVPTWHGRSQHPAFDGHLVLDQHRQVGLGSERSAWLGRLWLCQAGPEGM